MHNSKKYYNQGIIKNWCSGMLSQTQLSQIRFYAKLDEVKTFHSILRAISFSESAVFQIGDQGVKIIVEEDRTVQASAYFNKRDYGFSEYRYKSQKNNGDIISFNINIRVIVENLNMFSEDESQLKILYKGDCAPLVMIIDSDEDDLTTECSINTRELNSVIDLEKYEENIVLITFRGYDFFVFLNDLLKAVPSAEDFELKITSQSFTTIMRGSIDTIAEYNLDNSSDIIIFFRCSNHINVKYKSAHLKLLLKTLQISQTATLSVDKEGMLGVQLTIEDENEYQSYVKYLIIPLDDSEA